MLWATTEDYDGTAVTSNTPINSGSATCFNGTFVGANYPPMTAVFTQSGSTQIDANVTFQYLSGTYILENS